MFDHIDTAVDADWTPWPVIRGSVKMKPLGPHNIISLL